MDTLSAFFVFELVLVVALAFAFLFVVALSLKKLCNRKKFFLPFVKSKTRRIILVFVILYILVFITLANFFNERATEDISKFIENVRLCEYVMIMDVFWDPVQEDSAYEDIIVSNPKILGDLENALTKQQYKLQCIGHRPEFRNFMDVHLFKRNNNNKLCSKIVPIIKTGFETMHPSVFLRSGFYRYECSDKDLISTIRKIIRQSDPNQQEQIEKDTSLGESNLVES